MPKNGRRSSTQTYGWPMASTYATRAEVQAVTGLSDVTEAEINIAEDDIDRFLGDMDTFDEVTGRELQPARLNGRERKGLRAATARQVKYRRDMGPSGIFDKPQRDEVAGPKGTAKGQLPWLHPMAREDLSAAGLINRVRSFSDRGGYCAEDRCWVLVEERPW